jgi:hypothetical protein
MDSIFLPAVHPAFERLKRSSTWLHLLAGFLILIHALSHFRSRELSSLYFWCQLLISLDIFILVLAGRDILRQLPRVNLFFRLVEIIFFLGIGTLMLTQGNRWSGIFHLSMSMAYCYLFYCEKRLSGAEKPAFRPAEES